MASAHRYTRAKVNRGPLSIQQQTGVVVNKNAILDHDTSS